MRSIATALRRLKAKLNSPQAICSRIFLKSVPGIKAFAARHRRLKNLGLVLEADYAGRYLGTRKLKGLALLHYLAIGERLGLRPNPFFAPRHFARASGNKHRTLLEYIDHYAQSEVSPSPEFEPSWYTWQNQDWSQNDPHPFLHFCRVGLAQSRDPAPGIDITRLKTTLRDPDANLMRLLYNQAVTRGRFDPSFAAYTPEELLHAQEAFKRAIAVQIHRENASGKRRFLVFVQASKKFNCAYLLPERNFDLLLNFYDGPPQGDWPGVEYLVSQRGTKTTAIAKLLEMRPDILLQYEAVLFLDDDIYISPSALDTFFTEMENAGLDLAQPSLSAESDCVWPNLKQPQVGPMVRRLNAVEIMMPAVSRFALERAGWTFARSVSGFGVDLLLGHEVVDRLGRKAGVIGNVVAVHEKPIDTHRGPFYTFLRSNGINPKHELWVIMKEFGFEAAFVYRD